MPSFDEELSALGSDGPSFDDELAALQEPEPVKEQVSMGASPSGIQFSAAPADVEKWNAGAPSEPPPDMDFSGDPMAVPQRGGMEGLYDKLFNGRAQQSYDQIASGVNKSGVKYEQPRISEAYTGAMMGPVAGGIAHGMLRGGRESQAQDFGGVALDAAEGGLYGGLAGGASKAIGAGSKYFGNAARWAGDKLSDIADSDLVKKGAMWAGGGLGGSAGAGIGSIFGGPATAAGTMLGTAAGGAVAQRAVPAAIRGAGNVSRGVGNAAGAMNTTAMQSFETMGANQAISRGLDREQNLEQATDAGRGNMLGDAALDALQTNPAVLGSYAGEFAKAAASPDVGAVNNLITKLAQKDPKFRAGPMVELQRMTAE